MKRQKPSEQTSPYAQIGGSAVEIVDPQPSQKKRLQIRPHAASGHRGDDTGDDGDRLLTAAQTKRHYGGTSDMWLWRRLHDESGFPKPIIICGRRFWRMTALIAWERSRAVAAA